jgi:hypothetical protein
VKADAIDGEEEESDQDFLAQFFDLEDGRKPALPEGAESGFHHRGGGRHGILLESLQLPLQISDCRFQIADVKSAI